MVLGELAERLEERRRVGDDAAGDGEDAVVDAKDALGPVRREQAFGRRARRRRPHRGERHAVAAADAHGERPPVHGPLGVLDLVDAALGREEAPAVVEPPLPRRRRLALRRRVPARRAAAPARRQEQHGDPEHREDVGVGVPWQGRS